MPDPHDTSETKSLTYADAGVDIEKGNQLVEAIKPLIKATQRSGTVGNIGGFGGLFDLKATGFNDPLLVAANDGVGTKLKLAIDTGIHDTVGIDLTAMCVNDLIVQGAEPLFFLDYFACGTLKSGVAQDVIKGIASGCATAGCALIGGETAEMPGMYADGDYDLAGFCVGAVERDQLLPKPTIEDGDKIIGLASDGVHSNGFSLVRKIIDHSGLSLTDPAPFQPDQSLGQALLTPTRIYVQPLLEVFKQTDDIKALAHITGGGLIENIPRVLPTGLGAKIDMACLTPPPVFGWLQENGNVNETEMLRTFNCGVGMVVICQHQAANKLITHLNDKGETASLIGEIVSSPTPFITQNQVQFS